MNFCYWNVSPQGNPENSICTGRLFAGQVSKCPYKTVAEAMARCSELLIRKEFKKYNKPDIVLEHKQAKVLNLKGRKLVLQKKSSIILKDRRELEEMSVEE